LLFFEKTPKFQNHKKKKASELKIKNGKFFKLKGKDY